MAAVLLQNVTRQFGPQVVLSDVTLELHAGQVTGLVGVNGAGKTTIFRLISGEIVPDTGAVTRSRGLKFGYLRQEPQVSLDRTLHEEVGSVFTDLLNLEARIHDVSEQMADPALADRLDELMRTYDRLNNEFIAAGGHTFEARMNEILGGLGFSESDHALSMSVLSGGQRCRASLAKLLLEDRQMLLLDEPTNHLDIDAVRWLEKFLASHHGGAVIISHDRYLLDRLCDRIIEVARGTVFSYPGNYTNFANTRHLRELTQQRQHEKDKEFIEKERAFIAKHLAGQRSNEAKGRRTRLERRLKAGEFVTEDVARQRSARLEFQGQGGAGASSVARSTSTSASQGILLRCDDLEMGYGGKSLFKGLSFQVYDGQRFGITGPNGTGKSTLLKILLKQVAPLAGEVTCDSKQAIGYYAQESSTSLDPTRTILDEIRSEFPELTAERARTILGTYLFTGNDVFKPLGALSGGEQSRVRLAKLILQAPDLLILDEPTNHLDIPSREVLEESLSEYEGTIIAVSHDRYFLDRIVDRLLVIRPDEHRLFDGNYSHYIERMEQEKVAAQRKLEVSRDRKRIDKENAAPKRKREKTPYDHLSLAQVESMLLERETQLTGLTERFGDPAVYKNPRLLEELHEQADTLKAEIQGLNNAWESHVDAM